MKSGEILSFLLFVSGYMLGRIDSIVGLFKKKKSDSFLNDCDVSDKVKKLRQKHEIDDKKFVTKVSTDALEKKGADLGTKSEVEDDIASETSKLSMLKKKRG